MYNDVIVIISEYDKLNQDTEKRILAIKNNIIKQKIDELEKARNKIYDYFENIQDVFPSNFRLTIELDISLDNLINKTSIYFKDDDVILSLSCHTARYYYNLSRKNKASKFGVFEDDIRELEETCHIVNLVKNWDKVQHKIELEVQKYFENHINKQINEVSNDLAITKLLAEFNS